MDYSFNVQIAKITHSTDEAVFVHRVYYLVMNNEANKRNFHEGKYWTYDSVAALAKVFSFWTPRQIERIIRNCIKFGLIETGNFSDNPCDRRTWYTVSQTVKSIYANGEMDSTEWENENTQTVETIPPNGEMLYKEQLKDLLEDQLEAASKLTAETVAELYSKFCPNLPRCIKLTDKRRKAVQTLAKRGYTMENIQTAFSKANDSAFCTGQGERGWRADFDWLMNETNLVKVLEGKYDDELPKDKPKPTEEDYRWL